jgi:dTDP-4-dehydrorhamnose reductase
MRITIIGANGQLGMDLMAAFAKDECIGLTHADIEISDLDSVNRVLTTLRPEVVVNTAAYHKVDDCEKFPERSYQINAIGALNLAKVAESLGVPLVHISTDYVFDGEKKAPYVESDLPHPLNTYAVTKVAGEQYVRANAPKHFIVRSSGLYGHNPCRAKGGRNFIDTMLKLAAEKPEVRVVNDEILTPTYTHHLALQIRELVKTEAYGLYHATNNEWCSWYEFAEEIFRIAGVTTPLLPVSAKEFPAPIKRPSYSVLENAGLQKIGIDKMPVWKESLAAYFAGKQVKAK